MKKTAMHYPSMVMIIRHGEKPGDLSSDHDGGPNLSILGSARATAIPSLFTPDPKTPSIGAMDQLTCDLTAGRTAGNFTGAYSSSKAPVGQSRFPAPDFLFASKPDAGSNRPVETITPLALALQCFNNPEISINDKFANDDTKGLTSEIRNNSIYAGKVILICWHHGKIPKLAKALRVHPSQLPWKKWPPTIFDLIFCITWKDGQANLEVANQLLLQGDSQDCDPSFTSGSITLVLDSPMTPANPLPKNFRSMNGLNMKDMKGRLASGSAQYSSKQLHHIIKHEVGKHPLTVVDLRQETHGFLRLKKPLNGESNIAVGWFAERDWINVAKGYASIQADEISKLALAAKSRNLEVFVINTKTTNEAGICTATSHLVSPTSSYYTEQKLLQAQNIDYIRFPTTDRCRPRDSEVDRFIAFESTLEEDKWVHFHCRAGDGRTTTFMAMHDIYHNAPGDPLNFILGRQEGLGGVNLRDSNKSIDNFEYPFELERIEFVKNFYNYICEFKPGGFQIKWSDWVILNAMQT